jgi:hypothetical protein
VQALDDIRLARYQTQCFLTGDFGVGGGERLCYRFALANRAGIALQPEGQVGSGFQNLGPQRMLEHLGKITALEEGQHGADA